jgi:hypothetical protein
MKEKEWIVYGVRISVEENWNLASVMEEKLKDSHWL